MGRCGLGAHSSRPCPFINGPTRVIVDGFVARSHLLLSVLTIPDRHGPGPLWSADFVYDQHRQVCLTVHNGNMLGLSTRSGCRIFKFFQFKNKFKIFP